MRNWIGRVSLTLLIAAIVIFGMLWNNYEGKKRDLAKQALRTINQEIEETGRLASLGEISIDPSGLTLEKLNDVLRQPPHKLESRGGSNRLGWACGGELCALNAAFLVPAGEDVPLSTTPFQITLSKPGFGKPFAGSIGGIHLGDSPDTILAVCRKHGYGASKGPNRLTLNSDWEVAWTGGNRATDLLIFWNMSALAKSGAKQEGARN
jgi:hypothetical protein